MTTSAAANDFLPQGYEAPTSGGAYMKFENGENRFRILSKPIVGWVDWKDKKPYRHQMNDKPLPFDATKPVKHFWAFIVWNYKTARVEILEITQSTIQSAVANLSKDSDWGTPFKYDIKVIKSGAGMETEYSVNPVPHKEVAQDVKDGFFATKINLEKLFSGENPFEATAEAKSAMTVVDEELESDLPF